MNKSQLTSKLKLINLQELVFEVVETINKGEQISFVNEDTKLYERVQHEIEQEVKKDCLKKENYLKKTSSTISKLMTKNIIVY